MIFGEPYKEGKYKDVEILFFTDVYARMINELVVKHGMTIRDAFYAFFTSDFKRECEEYGLESLYYSKELMKEIKENYEKQKDT